MVFLTRAGGLVSKLNAFKDFPDMHPDVAASRATRHVLRRDEHAHRKLFLKHVALHFGKE